MSRSKEEAVAAGVALSGTKHNMKRRKPWHDYSRKDTYMLTLVAGMAVVSLDDLGLVEAISASLTCVSNVGPALGALGPTSHFGILSPLSKYVLSLLMLMGRLELMPLLVLLTRNAWKK